MKKLSILIFVVMTCLEMSAAVGRIAERPRYGTNYTVPFAHAYRALGMLGVDHREAIDRDVYHMARMGLDAFRLHLWDVELTDSCGNLIANEHLDLLDYLIARLKERRIDIVLTAQTNFGNGYPERNTDIYGAYSYDYPKCEIHEIAASQEAQSRYLDALAKHVNPYTGLSYSADPSIIAIEINNEPCHSGDHSQITAYIDRMAETLRSAGWDKDILYNVSHNLWRTSAFYDARIDGTTYQWYPTGLVKGSKRCGNFLPTLDSYDIPWDTLPGYSERTRVIYEYDPADILDTYLYPAAARTFRKAGFDWITQFAYDPIDMAAYNTEYQTHWLNLAYTPGKAVGMMIAAEAARRIPSGADYGKYPVDTVFGERGEFTVSYRRNLALLNDGEIYYHTNSTTDAPRNPEGLKALAGVGSSPIVTTDGSGVYFADKLADGVWRLEVMPDVMVVDEPFARPSLSRRVAEILPGDINMEVLLPGLPEGFRYMSVDGSQSGHADGYSLSLMPGVWVLGDVEAVDANSVYGHGTCRIGEYVAPQHHNVPVRVIFDPATIVTDGRLTATVVTDHPVDSVVLYPKEINFWNENNRLYTMQRTGKYEYTADLGTRLDKIDGLYEFQIVVFDGGKVLTFPGRHEGTPLDWDYQAGPDTFGRYFTAKVGRAAKAIDLLCPDARDNTVELATIPESWTGVSLRYHDQRPKGEGVLRLHKNEACSAEHLVVYKWVAPLTAGSTLADGARLNLRLGAVEGVESLSIGVVNRDGFTYTSTRAPASDSVIAVDINDMTLDDTWLNPAPFPAFLSRKFTPDPTTATPLKISEIEQVVITVPAPLCEVKLDIAGIWIE